MDNKPRFCHSCGAVLVGEAAFCASCGAKQPSAIPTAAPATEAAPVVEAAPVPAEAPETSLAAPKKASISVIGLILAIGALCLSLLGSFLFYIFNWLLFLWGNFLEPQRVDPQWLIHLLRRPDFLVGLFTGLVVPLIALVAVLIKKKPAAIIGMALIALLIVCQLVITGSYMGLMRGKPGIFRHLPISVIAATNMVNGEKLFTWGRSIFYHKDPYWLCALSDLLFHLKNYMALLACLLVATKKKK